MSLYDSSITPPLIVNFNSKDRVSGTNSNFNSIPVDLGHNAFDTVCLVQASIPKSFYNMPSGYNTFTLTENDGVTTTSVTVTIPPGNYNRINLQSVLATVLTNASPDGLTYTVGYPASTVADTFHYTFGVNAPSTYTISFTFTSRSPFRQLGFDVGTYTFTDVTLILQELESVNALNLSYILRAFIKSNLVADATDSILEEILSFGSFPSSSVVHYIQYNFDMNSRKLSPSAKNSWNFVLQDAFGQEIQLEGVPWAFSVVFFQRNKTHEIHKTELMITNEERLFKIEQEQKGLQEQLTAPVEENKQEGLITTLPPQPDFVSETQPLYPVEPPGVTRQFAPSPQPNL
jgi:hypothetical protein